MQPINLMSWVLAIFLGLLGLTIIVYIWTGKIDITRIISERDGSASMSRFQMLVFTFVVAVSLFIITISEPRGFPDIPNGILELLGISLGTYAVSKGIQTQGEISEDTNNLKSKQLDLQQAGK